LIYADVQDTIDKFGLAEMLALSNLDDPSLTIVNAALILENLIDASAEIDAYIAGRYNLPLPEVPAALKAACLDITRYRLSRVRPREDVRQRYEDWIRFLRDVAMGKASLGLPQNSAIDGNLVSVKISNPDRVFSENTLKSFNRERLSY
jgi:phage gp36-like protein